jgi:hypothetical protein
MSEREKFKEWWSEGMGKEASVGTQFNCWQAWQAARAPLLERITTLEAKCALLAASWQKAEDTVRRLSEPVEAAWSIPEMTTVCVHCGGRWTDDHPDVCTGR